MRCPKCGYNSFDYLDSCKKCGKDLVEFKQRFGIKSVLFPGATAAVATDLAEDEHLLADEASELAAATALGAADVASAASTAPQPPADDSAGDDFGFDFMGESSDEEDLSFDELFEEAPQEDDMEETLEAPKGRTAADTAEAEESDFAFDMPEADDELEDGFGLDAEDVAEDEAEPGKTKGSAEGPTDPFDLPESSPEVGAPVPSTPGAGVTTTVAAPAAMARQQPGSQSPEEDGGLEPAQEDDLRDQPAVDQDQILSNLHEVAAAAPPEEEVPPAAVPASLAGRFAACVYDVVILLVIGLGFVVAAELSMSRATGPLPTMETLIDLSVPYFLVLFSLTFGYFTLFHFLAGQTPGKMLTGLQVETSGGEPLTFSQAFLRSVGGLLQLLPLGLGYLQLLLSGDGRGWNDRLAGTRVVRVALKK